MFTLIFRKVCECIDTENIKLTTCTLNCRLTRPRNHVRKWQFFKYFVRLRVMHCNEKIMIIRSSRKMLIYLTSQLRYIFFNKTVICLFRRYLTRELICHKSISILGLQKWYFIYLFLRKSQCFPFNAVC